MKRYLWIAVFSLMGFAQGGYQIGDTVRDFSLKNVDGSTVSLNGNKTTKGVIVAFTCNTCPVAKAYEERLIGLHQSFAAKGYPVVAIQSNDASLSPGDSFDQMKARAKEKNYPFPYLYDESQAIAKTFGATNTPHLFVLKRVGEDLQVAYIGAIDNAKDPGAVTKHYVDDAVSELLDGKPVTMPSARAVGCGIKWKSM